MLFCFSVPFFLFFHLSSQRNEALTEGEQEEEEDEGEVVRRRRRRRKRRSRIGGSEERAVCRAGLLWITWSSAGLRIYSSTAAVRGSGVSCMLLPRIAAKHGCGGSVCWILDSAALEPCSALAPTRTAYAALALRGNICTSL